VSLANKALQLFKLTLVSRLGEIEVVFQTFYDKIISKTQKFTLTIIGLFRVMLNTARNIVMQLNNLEVNPPNFTIPGGGGGGGGGESSTIPSLPSLPNIPHVPGGAESFLGAILNNRRFSASSTSTLRRTAAQTSIVNNQFFNQTIHTSARVEPIIGDFKQLESLAALR
jgi:hypothetical protein